MNIIALDNEKLMLRQLEHELKKVFPKDTVSCFENISECLGYVERILYSAGTVEYAFLEIRLSDGSGLELAKLLRKSFPTMKIVFCTAFSEYSMEAFKLCANGYLLKPIKASQIYELVRTLEPTANAPIPRVVIHTFGNFDVFIDGKLVIFTKSKAKELLAYLVDRNGASVSSAEIGAVLWEDQIDADLTKDRVQHVKKDLRDILAEYGAEDILVSGWNSFAIDKSKVSCDYYSFLKGETEAVQSYLGEYMTNYSWSEDTAGALRFSQKKLFQTKTLPP